MKRLVERLSREENVQETQEAGGVASRPRRHLVKGLYLRKFSQDEVMEESEEEVKGQNGKWGVATGDEIMGGYEEAIEEEYMK
ncbi:hypothetical protein Q9L58_000950 [Maublancomyces gigas]|uniref:Uncharacterized protein n=1 Tax=Discina gigas TaxID=1032678 RepID=A0ABR3GWP7_9PEZI